VVEAATPASDSPGAGAHGANIILKAATCYKKVREFKGTF
jgi:hypothetical protein